MPGDNVISLSDITFINEYNHTHIIYQNEWKGLSDMVQKETGSISHNVGFLGQIKY